MKEAINFVKLGVATRNFEETVTQIHACGNTIQSYNGIVLMSHPLKKIGKFSVESAGLIKAIEACDWKPELKMTDKNLIVRSKNFRVLLEYDTVYEKHKKPKGKYTKLSDKTVAGIKLLMPFVSDDASRDWSQSMYIKDSWMYVTNNIIAARVKTDLPDCTLPLSLLSVMQKCKREPVAALFQDNKITIDYGSDVWIKSNTIATKWPPVEQLFKHKWKKLKKVPETFVTAVDKISPFTGIVDDVKLDGEGTMTAGHCTIKDVPGPEIGFNCTQMKLLLSLFTNADFSKYPKPMPVCNDDGIQGVFVGMMI